MTSICRRLPLIQFCMTHLYIDVVGGLHSNPCNWPPISYLKNDGGTTWIAPLWQCLFVFLKTRQIIHHIFIIVDRHVQRMGDKMNLDLGKLCLQLLYPPFILGIDLPNQGIPDSYNQFSLPGKKRLISWSYYKHIISFMESAFPQAKPVINMLSVALV